MNDKDHFKLVTGYKDSLSNTLTMVAGNTQPVPLSYQSWRTVDGSLGSAVSLRPSTAACFSSVTGQT